MAVHVARQVRPGFEPHSSMLFDVADTGFWAASLRVLTDRIGEFVDAAGSSDLTDS